MSCRLFVMLTPTKEHVLARAWRHGYLAGLEQGATQAENPFRLTNPQHRACWENGRVFGVMVYAVMKKDAKRYMKKS